MIKEIWKKRNQCIYFCNPLLCPVAGSFPFFTLDIIGSIVVSPDKIKLVLRVEGLKQLAEEMAVGGYFSENHEASEEELPEMKQRILHDGGIELTMSLKLKSIGGHRNVIVPEGNGMTLRQDAVIRAIRNARKWTDMLVTGQAANPDRPCEEAWTGHTLRHAHPWSGQSRSGHH